MILIFFLASLKDFAAETLSSPYVLQPNDKRRERQGTKEVARVHFPTFGRLAVFNT
jgi:hypothetical protein